MEITMSQDQATAAVVDTNLPYLPKEMSFFFRTKKQKNELGEEVEVKRPTVKLNVPVITIDGLVALLNEGNGTKVAGLLSVLEDVIYKQAKEQVDEDEAITQEKLDLNKLTLDYILALPPSSRSSNAPTDEQWKLFEADYPATMAPVQPERTIEQINLARDLFLKKLTPVKDKPEMLKVLKGYIALWFTNSKQQEELSTVFEYINQRADALIAQPPKVLTLDAI
jgi:hypothetical protein